jgi:heptosyltransferase-1
LKILIVKLSSLGDVVHAMPAVQDIRQAYPDAQIDWVVELVMKIGMYFGNN